MEIDGPKEREPKDSSLKDADKEADRKMSGEDNHDSAVELMNTSASDKEIDTKPPNFTDLDELD